MAEPIQLTAICEGDFALGMAAFVRIGEVRFRSFASFVQNVTTRAGASKISELTVIAHGYEGSGAMFFDPEMEECLGHENFGDFQAGFARLRRSMVSTDGQLVMKVCFLGSNGQLLQKLANATGCTITGYTGEAKTAFAFGTGRRVIKSPITL